MWGPPSADTGIVSASPVHREAQSGCTSLDETLLWSPRCDEEQSPVDANLALQQQECSFRSPVAGAATDVDEDWAARLPISRVGQAHFAPRRRSSTANTPLRSEEDSRAATNQEEDHPGTYVIVHENTAVTAERAAAPPTLANLAAGTCVNVLEVLHMAEEQRVRGRIKEPEGWISLLDTSDGYRWARRQTSQEPAIHALVVKDDLSVTLGNIAQEQPSTMLSATDGLTVTLGASSKESPPILLSAKDDLTVTLGGVGQEFDLTADDSEHERCAVYEEPSATSLSAKDDLTVTLGAVCEEPSKTLFSAADCLEVTLGANNQESHVASFGAKDDLSTTLGDFDKDPQSTMLGARDDLSVTLGVCQEPQAASFTAKDDLSITLGNVGLDENPKSKLTFTTQILEENDEEDEKQSQPPATGDHHPGVCALGLPSREEPKLQSPVGQIRHARKEVSNPLLDETLEHIANLGLNADMKECADMLMDTVITAVPDERSKAFDNSCAAEPGQRADLDRATDSSSASSEAARDLAETPSPERPMERAASAPENSSVLRATSGTFGRRFTDMGMDMSFGTYDAACMELPTREELELHMGLRESLLQQLPGSAFPQGVKGMSQALSQAPNATPRATLMVRPATMDKVGTVCRKPRPKAMQRGRISGP